MLKAPANCIALFIAAFFFIASGKSTAQPSRRGGHGTIVTIGPSVNFYRLNTRHALDARRRSGFVAGIRREIRVGNSYQTFIQAGAEYFVHGVSYASYYFNQDTLQLYDGNYDHQYAIYIHEVNVPLQLKVLFKRGDNRIYSPYASIAYHLRYLLPSPIQVLRYGNNVRKDHPQVKFRNHLIHENVNAFVSAGLGWQRNKISASGTAFFAELNFRYGFSDYYFERSYAARSVYINSTHLLLMLGLKF